MVLTWEREQNIYNVTFDKFCKKQKIRQSVTPENIFSSEYLVAGDTLPLVECHPG